MKYLNIIILFLIAFLSCRDNSKKVQEIIIEWQHREIIFPEKVVFTKYGKDTIDYNINTVNKILVYVDSIGCTSCKMKLSEWKKFIYEVDSISKGKTSFVFIIHPQSIPEIRGLLSSNAFNHPVCIDRYDILNKTNKFPNLIEFQTFLLDKNNRVVLIGNPILNPAIKSLYIKTITGKEPEKRAETTAEATEQEKDIGAFDKYEKRTAAFEIKKYRQQPVSDS